MGWDEAQAFELLSGTSNTSTEPGCRLHALAQMAYKRPAVRRLLDEIDEGTADRLQDIDTEFAEAFDHYQQTYGCRSVCWGIMYPSLAERPLLTLSLIRDQLLRRYDPVQADAKLAKKRSKKVDKATALLAGNAKITSRFKRALKRAER